MASYDHPEGVAPVCLLNVPTDLKPERIPASGKNTVTLLTPPVYVGLDTGGDPEAKWMSTTLEKTTIPDSFKTPGYLIE